MQKKIIDVQEMRSSSSSRPLKNGSLRLIRSRIEHGRFQLSFFSNHANEINGVQLGLGVNFAHLVKGIQLSFGVTGNIAGRMNGVQISALENIINVPYPEFTDMSEESHGVQIGPLNAAVRFHGFQAGVINFSQEGDGFQLGILNHSSAGDVLQFGLLNRIDENPFLLRLLPFVNIRFR